jgi:hypothetical protein
MRASRLLWTASVCAALFAAPPGVSAQTSSAQDTAATIRSEIEQLKADFNARIAALEAQLAAATGPVTPAPAAQTPPVAAVPPGAEAGGGQAGTLPVYGNAASNSKVFNPDMAVIGNVLGAAGENSVMPTPAIEMPESEVSFQAIVDPYARADFFIAFGESGVNLEEGFATFPTVPGGLLVKVGKMRAAFGKVNTLHTHVLPWTDRPLVTGNLLNGEDGINDVGVSVAKILPLRDFFLEATGQVFRGTSGEVFQAGARDELSYVAHLKGYQDLSESSNVEVGGSYARGYANPVLVRTLAGERFTSNLFGVDATFRWKPLQRAIYHSFVGRSEFVWNQRDEPGFDQAAFGYYVSADYQLGRRWFTGVRFDSSDRSVDPSAHDSGGSLIVTYVPTEFSQLRGQYRRTTYAEGETANEVLFQLQFAIGAHGAHPF